MVDPYHLFYCYLYKGVYKAANTNNTNIIGSCVYKLIGREKEGIIVREWEGGREWAISEGGKTIMRIERKREGN